jgi:hypothetical protein
VAANPASFYRVLRSKLQPSFDIQSLGSVQPSIRSSTTFGPRINAIDWGKLRGKQAGETLKNQLGNMSG